MSDIRYNTLDDRYVIIAPERLHRPFFNPKPLTQEQLVLEHISSCPFCEGNESKTTPEIYAIRDKNSKADEKGWKIRVVPNLYKALSIETDHYAHYNGLFQTHRGFGAHEIVIDTPQHDLKMHQWSEKSTINWFNILKYRINDLKSDYRLQTLSIFKNSGVKAGASQEHPHTQIIGLPIIPTQLLHQFRRFHQHYLNTGRILIEDMIVQEYKDSTRIILDNDSFVAFCPFASEYPFEVMIVAKEGLSRLEYIDDKELKELSSLFIEIFKRLQREIGEFDYNISISIPPLQNTSQTGSFYHDIDKISRLNIRITPRIYQHAGFETSMGMMINPVTPEEATKRLRG